jgi:hypothetical protein
VSYPHDTYIKPSANHILGSFSNNSSENTLYSSYYCPEFEAVAEHYLKLVEEGDQPVLAAYIKQRQEVATKVMRVSVQTTRLSLAFCSSITEWCSNQNMALSRGRECQEGETCSGAIE